MSDPQIEITQLLHRYCHCVDRGGPQDVAALFAEDAVLRPRFDGDYEVQGRSAIADWYAHYNASFRERVRHLKHLLHSPLIQPSADCTRADGSTYFTAAFVSGDPARLAVAYGTYTDVLVRQFGAWLIGERTIDTHMVAPDVPASEVFPSLGYPGAG